MRTIKFKNGSTMRISDDASDAWQSLDANERATRSAAMHKLGDFQLKHRQLGPVEYDAALLRWVYEGLEDCFGLCDDERSVILQWRNQ